MFALGDFIYMSAIKIPHTLMNIRINFIINGFLNVREMQFAQHNVIIISLYGDVKYN